MSDGLEALTEKEREALRLITRGYDAKSAARHLDLSVHTINERLRSARRKLSTTSSREAARILLDREEATQFLGPKPLGEAEAATPEAEPASTSHRAALRRPAFVVAGVCLMSFVLTAALVLTSPTQTPDAARGAPTKASAQDAAAVEAARDFLLLIDGARWAESYAATTERFRQLNSVAAWTAASEQARGPLGAVRSREFAYQDFLPAPPRGYAVVKFRTRFASRPAVETVTLERDGAAWRVAGIVID